MPRTKAPVSAKDRLAAFVLALTDEQCWTGLAALPAVPTSPEEGIARHALLEAVELRFPAAAVWVDKFFEVPLEHPNWDVPYTTALLLAREELGL